jgi:peptidyl-prolyl cis-trans isomerase C
MRSVARDPLVHFAVLGAVMFGAFALLQDEADAPPSSTEIRYTVDDVAQLLFGFEAQWNRPPTQEEFNALVEDRVRQDILYREALALGLDKNDTIVMRRMAQKMQFIAEDTAAAHAPTTEELKAWFAENGDLFRMAPRVSFRHLYFSPDRRGKNARADAEAALASLAGQPETLPEGTAPGDRFMFQDYYGERTPQAIAREFGPQFAQAVAQLPPGSWQGPVQSGLGWHLVYVDKLIPGRVPAFEEIAEEVKTAWLGKQKAAAWQKAYDGMRAKYTVLLPVPTEDAITDISRAVPAASAAVSDDGAPL